MSKTLERSGSITFTDKLRTELSRSEKKIYDQSWLSSVSLTDENNSKYSIDFYPILPIWLSIGTLLFGEGNHSQILLFFSILSIIGAYYFVENVVPQNRLAPTLSAWLIAINPGLVFLAKYPVTESISFALTINAANLFIIANKTFRLKEKFFYLALSLMLLTTFFFLRMSFPVVIAGIFLIFLKALSESKANINSRANRIFVIFAFLALYVSFLFYRTKQWNLFEQVYTTIFQPILGEHTLIIAGVFAVIFFTLSSFLDLKSVSRKTLEYAYQIDFRIVFKSIFLIGLVVGLYKIYYEGSLGDPGWGYLSKSNRSFKFHALFNFVLLISPNLAAVLLFKLKSDRTTEQIVQFLYFNLSWFLLITLFWTFSTPYLYYFSRYLLSEIVPYSLILIGILISNLKIDGKVTSFSLHVLAASSYSLYFSLFQINKTEGDSNNFFSNIARELKEEDVIICKSSEISRAIVEPLRYYFGKKVFFLNEAKSGIGLLEAMTSLKNKNFSVFYLRPGNGQKNYLLERGILHNGSHTAFGNISEVIGFSSYLLPHLYTVEKTVYSLNQIPNEYLENKYFISGSVVDFKSNGNSWLYISGDWGQQEDLFRWTTGKESMLTVSAHNRINSITINAETFSLKHPQKILVEINGNIIFSKKIDGSYSQKINTAFLNSNKLNIKFLHPECYSPKSIEFNSDDRCLGSKFETVTLELQE